MQDPIFKLNNAAVLFRFFKIINFNEATNEFTHAEKIYAHEQAQIAANSGQQCNDVHLGRLLREHIRERIIKDSDNWHTVLTRNVIYLSWDKVARQISIFSYVVNINLAEQLYLIKSKGELSAIAL